MNESLVDRPRLRQVLFSSGVAVGGAAVFLALLGWDECSTDAHRSTELLGRIKAAAMLLLLGNVYLVLWRRTWLARVQGGLGGVVALLSIVIATTLEADSHRLQMRLSGLVVAKYRSENHGAAAVDISSGGERLKVEYLAADFWKSVKVGDRVVKAACGREGLLEGKRVRIFP